MNVFSDGHAGYIHADAEVYTFLFYVRFNVVCMQGNGGLRGGFIGRPDFWFYGPRVLFEFA